MIAIVNRGAGVASKGTESLRDRTVALYTAAGVDVHVTEPGAADDVTTIARDAARAGETKVVAAGGDGTISSVAAAVAGSNTALGVLPTGTLNHFAKDLGIPLDLASAVQTTITGRIETVDAAEVNGRIFINNSSLGIYPHIVSNREAQQERLARGKWHAFAWAAVHAFRRFPFLNLRITVDDQQLVRRTAFLFVGNNEYQIAGFNLGARRCINAGKLGLYLTHRTGRFGLFRLALHALLGRVDQARDFNAFCVEEALIEARRARVLVACDGEVTWMETPLHYRTRRQALRVLLPQNATS